MPDILFSARMARKITMSEKTQTRRVVALPRDFDRHDLRVVSFEQGVAEIVNGRSDTCRVRCPYGGAGTILRGITDWAVSLEFNAVKPRGLPPTVKFWTAFDLTCPLIHIRQRDVELPVHPSSHNQINFGKVRPGRAMPGFIREHMPRLRVTDLRIKRLQAITEADAVAEGCKACVLDGVQVDTAVNDFALLWSSIHGKPGHEWHDSPLVWVVSFSVVQA